MSGTGKYAGRVGWALALSLLLGGCGLFGQRPHVFTATFVPVPIPEYTGNPTNIVEGRVTRGVTIRNSVTGRALGEEDVAATLDCVGVVTLRPYVKSSAYERELAGLSSRVQGATTLDPAYEEYQRQIQARSMTARCDAQGKFRFKNVPNGIFVVSVSVEQALGGGWTWERVHRGGVVIPEGSSGQTYMEGDRCEVLGEHPSVSREDKARWKCD